MTGTWTHLFATAALAVLPLAAQSGLQCRAGELAAHPFDLRGLSVTVTNLDGYRLVAPERRHAGRARIALSIENKGKGFLPFSPQDLSLVGKDGTQVFPIYELNLASDAPPLSLRLAPGAHASVAYVLTGRLLFPARIYLADQLVAEVTE